MVQSAYGAVSFLRKCRTISLLLKRQSVINDPRSRALPGQPGFPLAQSMHPSGNNDVRSEGFNLALNAQYFFCA